MERIIALVSERAGISEEQAADAVETVGSFLKEKMPDAMGAQLESILFGEDELGSA